MATLLVVATTFQATYAGNLFAADFTLKANSSTVHWGFYSKLLTPKLTVPSGAIVDVEMLSHHSGDDYDKMVKGDAGMESIFAFPSGNTPATQMRGFTGGGDGVHILTGPIYVTDAVPGDVIGVEILDLQPRPNAAGDTYGTNAGAWWGFDYGINGPSKPGLHDPNMPKQKEMTTIYKAIKNSNGKTIYAEPVYQFQYGKTPIVTDCVVGTNVNSSYSPGVGVPCVGGKQTWTGYQFPGLVTVHPTGNEDYTVNGNRFRIPVNMHIGSMGLAPSAVDYVDSIPPMPNGGNLDQRRFGVGATMYYPVKVAGGLLSMGDTHLAQGDSELDGTAIETSLNGRIQITLYKAASLPTKLKSLTFPLLENINEYVVHGFTYNDYLTELSYKQSGQPNLQNIYFLSDINKAMANAYVNMREFVMRFGYTESEARSLITLSVDFGITQVVDGNWGIHAILPKYVFDTSAAPAAYVSKTFCGTSTPLPAYATTYKSGSTRVQVMTALVVVIAAALML